MSAVVVAAKRRPIMLAASGVAILGLLVIAGWFWWRPSVGDISASSPTTSSASTLAAKPVRPAPPPASAPFDADAALAHQRAWAQWLGSVVETTNSIDMKLRLIPPGEFDMGATDEEVAERRRTFSQTSANRDTGFVKSANDAVNSEMPRRRIRITQPFWIGSYETTIGDFQRFCDETGYVAYSERMAVDVWGLNADGRYTVGPQYSWRKTGLPDNPRNAVGSLTWYDIEAFCHWLTGREGVVYRVPTEAEWEYACRAGTTHLTFFTADQLPKHANVPDQSLHRVISLEGGLAWHSWDDGFPSVSPVGSFLPNPFGLYDVIGNQWEVCLDWYSFDAYQKGTVEDPSGPSTGTRKVIRGGSHDPYTVPEAMTATCRIGVAVDNPQLTAGFRVIREIDPPAHAPLDPAWTAKLLARVRQAVDDAAALPLVGDFQMARAVDRWKAADVHLRRAERYSASTEGRAALAELAKTVAFGSRLAGGVREIDRKLVESLPETGWDLHYAGAAEGLAKLFGELGWDPTKIGAIEARTKLNALPPALRESVKHWLIRWELYAAVSKRPEVAALRGWALMLDDDAWKQRFLAARTAADPAMLLKFSAEPTGSRAQSAGDHVLMVESLAVAGLLGKPEAQKAVSGATVDVSKNADLFWAFLRKAQAEEMSTVTSEDPRTRNDKVWEAYRIATRLSPEKTVLRRRFDQSFKSSPAAAERELAEWVLQKGGTVQVWRPFPATDSWARFPIRSLSLLPSDLFHVTGLALTNCPITDADLLRLHNLPFLDTLFLDGTPITDDGVRKLSQSAEPLQTLSLERTQISDEGLVQTPVANELLLRNTNVTAAGVLKWQNERPSSFVIHESLFTDSNSLDQRAVRSESNRALVFDANCRVDAPIAIPSGASLTLEALIVPRARLGFNLAALIEVRVGGAPWKLDRNELYGAFLHYLNSRQVRLGALSNQGRSESAVGKPLVNTRLYNRLMHVAAVFEPDVFRLYVDGRIAAETKVAPFTRGTTGTLNIGRQPTDRLPELGQFMGLIDEVRISSIARYKEDFVPAERHEPDQHTLALYHFDEGEGDVAKDSSGHGRDGKITGAKWVKSLTYSPSLPTIPSSSADSSPTANVGSWVQLFDGKSLAGWKTPPKQPGDWSVQDGLLTGKGPLSLLFTERGDFEDFHGRAEVRINAGEKAASSLARKVF
ncbi:MAG: SUMF1/EgtB/PvdO family nonheme iron enzyme [Pirellulales bacterium]